MSTSNEWKALPLVSHVSPSSEFALLQELPALPLAKAIGYGRRGCSSWESTCRTVQGAVRGRGTSYIGLRVPRSRVSCRYCNAVKIVPQPRKPRASHLKS